jgi:hypothetical protein
MHRFIFGSAGIALLTLCSAANAAVFRFDTDPFAGSTAPTDPGRQVVGGEDFIDFSIPADLFSLESTVFGVDTPVVLVNDIAENLPTGGANVIVLESFDNDSDPATAFNAGTAASLIASRVTTPGPGFFIYFNQGLDLPRLVFSTDLSDETADLKVLFRMTNLTGDAGRAAMPTFSAANFAITTVPEPSSLFLISSAGAIAFCLYLRRRKRLS